MPIQTMCIVECNFPPSPHHHPSTYSLYAVHENKARLTHIASITAVLVVRLTIFNRIASMIPIRNKKMYHLTGIKCLI